METANTLGCELAAEVAGTFGRLYLQVSGTSMAPTVRPGDLVSVEPTGLTEISRGEIVVFVREGRLIVHRVRFIVTSSNGASCLITRGDRVRRDDAPVSGSELIGRVSHIKRALSTVPTPSQLNIEERACCRLLRFSDRATYLYLYLASRWSEFSQWRAVCRR